MILNGKAADPAVCPDSMCCVDLAFRYRSSRPWVVQDFNYIFQSGITLIKGASGCGKSTLLRLLAGFLKPCRGEILAPSGCAPTNAEFQRRELGFVFQQLNLLPLATVQRNLALAASIAGMRGEAIAESSERWLRMLGLE